jgi:hypothetical protein
MAAASNADTVLTGTTDGGAFYRIEVPDAWNGDLVIWNHGFSLDPIGPVSHEDLGPPAPGGSPRLQDLQLAQGYAVAASSYRQTGWAVFKTKNDLQNLLGVFKANIGKPNKVFLTGASLGGAVTAAAIEKAHIGNVAGAYTICGAMAGSRNWDGALDVRLTYDAICSSGVPGAFIPGGAAGLPAGSSLTETDTTLAVDACFGLLYPPGRTDPQQVRLDQFLDETQLPENFVLTNVAFYSTFGMSDFVHDPNRLAGKIGTSNEGVVYDDPDIEALIERVSPNPGAENRLEKHFTPTGTVGETKIISLHTDKDGLVIVENESEYASVVPASNLTTAIVFEDVPSHCGFAPAEVVAGWQALLAWVAGAPQPNAAGIQGLCLELEPAFGGPCRINLNPAYVIPDMDGRIPPR